MLRKLTDAGGYVIAEHTVGESFSGDGLIAVSFDERDKDFQVPVSHARYRDSLFGELEHDLAAATAARANAEQAAAAARQLAEQLQLRIDAIHATKTWRWTKAARVVHPHEEPSKAESDLGGELTARRGDLLTTRVPHRARHPSKVPKGYCRSWRVDLV